MAEEHPVVTAARELRPLLRAHRAESEEKGRLSATVVKEAGAAGLFVFTPRWRWAVSRSFPRSPPRPSSSWLLRTRRWLGMRATRPRSV